ncbi:alginate lyase family protein [Paenibacillus tuaregi]|uniref:alginate lyase family protein n=1 Tax=Paenibacillus tuaregi TaxID=1816681 RepID=UPI000ACCFC13|nr:alginate lyase family protein [Paenibacillus tuaregi]
MSANTPAPMEMESRLMDMLDLRHPSLDRVRKAAGQGEQPDKIYAALRQHWITKQAPVMFVRQEETEEICRYVRQYGGEALQQVMRTADEVVSGTFLFRFPWDMERTRVPVTFSGLVDWNHVPDRDVEWSYMLNRHRYWIALGQAYLLTREGKYAAVCCQLMEDWIDRNPVPEHSSPNAIPETGTLAWRSIEAGLRCVNWIKSLPYLLGGPHMTPRLTAKVLVSLHEHAEYLASSFSGWKRISNWGVLESCGLFMVSVFAPEFRRAPLWRQLSLQRLEETARLQVLQDGIHWEQSPTYHHEVLNCYLDVIRVACQEAIPLPEVVIQVARKMAYASLLEAKPNHRQPLRGDSDDNDVRSVLTAAALLFGDAELRFGGYDQVDYDNAWSFGIEEVRRYAKMPLSAPTQISHGFEHAGHYIMRSGWDEHAMYLNFRCGPLGGGHGHADMLHIDVHAYGRDFLTDLGRYNYSEHTPLRRELKCCRAHNTTLVDGVDFTEVTGTWAYGRIAHPSGTRWIPGRDIDYAEGSHDGYFGLKDPVRPIRKILFIKPGFWILIDTFISGELHSYSQLFHFAPGKVCLDGDSGICRTENGKGEPNFAIIPAEPDHLRAGLHTGTLSREYNWAEPHSYVEYERKGTKVTSLMQVLYPLAPGDEQIPVVEKVPVCRYTGEPASDEDVLAWRIQLPASLRTVLVAVCHHAPAGPLDSYVVEGNQIFGEVVVINQGLEESEIIVVK